MGWNYNNSRNRIQAHLDGMGKIEIEKLIREANLNTLLSETKCREIYGSHVYMQISNFAKLASQDPDDEDSYKKLIQAIHIYQREVSRIVESIDIFDALRVHFQGPKLHALIYRPIDDSEEIAARAVLLQLVLKDFVKSVFNPAFDSVDDFTLSGGADIGDVIGTRNGSRGDRELLFIGSPANHAAKIISSSGRLRITGRIYDALAEDLKKVCEKVEENLYKIKTVSREDLDELCNTYEIEWDREASADRIEDDKNSFPIKKIAYSSAETLIKIDDLSIRNNKRVHAASIYADVTGFTKYIESAENYDEQESALRVFHAIRKEMARVIKNDFKGIRVQFQGDRVQGLFHLPKDDGNAISADVVNAAIGLQSSMEHTLKECLPEAKELSLAIGIDIGTTLVSKLGKRAHRNRICLGEAVEKAAMNEERVNGEQIGISKAIYESLPDQLKEQFTYNSGDLCYVASSLTVDKVELITKAQAYQVGGAFYVNPNSSGVTISREESLGAKKIVPSHSYASKS